MAEQGEVGDLSSNDNLNDEYDVTWGGRVSRYLYNYTLQLPDKPDYDSDQTESIYSMQSKETIAIISESDLSSSNCCASDCDCDQSSNNLEEYEVLTSSNSSCNEYHFSSSDSSTTLEDIEVKKIVKICDDTLLGTDNGYIPDDTDVMITNSNIEVPPPACFRKCVQCRKDNPNPYFQYCHMCFSYRKEFFMSKPKPKPKSVKRLSVANCIKKPNLFKNSQQSDSMDMSQGENKMSSNIEHTVDNLCSICFKKPQNGLFNHGKISHICFCYTCAKEFKKKNDRCPVCNVKVTSVNKMITV